MIGTGDEMVVVGYPQAETVHRKVVKILDTEVLVQGTVPSELFLLVIEPRRAIYDHPCSRFHKVAYGTLDQCVFGIRQVKALGEDQEGIGVQCFCLEIFDKQRFIRKAGQVRHGCPGLAGRAGLTLGNTIRSLAHHYGHFRIPGGKRSGKQDGQEGCQQSFHSSAKWPVC